MLNRYALLLAVALFLLAPPVPRASAADATLNVDIGWGQSIRMGRWTPVTVTVSDPDGRDGLIELSTEHDRLYGMRVRQHLGTMSKVPRTFQLLVPINNYAPYYGDPVWVVLRDAKTGKTLARTLRPDEMAGPTRNRPQLTNVDPAGSFIGLTGRTASLNNLTMQVPGARISRGYMPQPLLPTVPLGYDMLDVLLLNAPDLNGFSAEQERAIVDWVRAGGNLLLYPGEDPLPKSGTLIDALPCTVGEVGTTELTPEQLDAAGLPRRFGKLTTRALSGREGAKAVTLIGREGLTAYRADAGLGQILVLPTDVTALQFNTAAKLWDTWKVVLDGMVEVTGDPLAQQTYSGGYDVKTVREESAKQHIADELGTVPGAGRFGFSYVAVVLIGMMIVVGPVDWLVLRMLKRQAWTWVTTSGWIALVTLGAIYVGHLFKSGDLHYRTFSLVDQADGRTVARRDFVGIYSPRTTVYDVEVTPTGWWEPLAPGMNMYGYYGAGRSSEVDFHQTYQGNSPRPMQINVWSLRFMEGETVETGPALIEASLTIEKGPKSGYLPHVVGTIKNLGDRPLKDVRVRTLRSEARLVEHIPAGESRAIDLPLTDIVSAHQIETNDQMAAGTVYYGPNQQNLPMDFWQFPERAAGGRAHRVQQRLEREDTLCVVAEVDAPPAPATLANHNTPNQRHRQLIRALVPVEQK